MENKTLLYELNKDETARMTPVILFLLLICVLGICGNGVSLYVFTTRFSPSNSRLFFIYLSSVEILACTVLIPVDVVALFHQLILISEYLCVGYIFLLVFQVQVAADILIVIAVDRWRRICHPFKWQLSYRMSKYLCIATLRFGAVEALPSLWIYGSHTVHVGEFNITGQECSINDSVRETIYPVLYVIFFWVITILRIIVLAVLYFKIMKTVKRHDKVIQTKINKYKTEGGSLISKTDAREEKFLRHKDSERFVELSTDLGKDDFEAFKTQFSTDDTKNLNDSLTSLPLSASVCKAQTPSHPYEKTISMDIDIESVVTNDNDTRDYDVETKPDKPRISKGSQGKPNSKRSRTVTLVMFTVTITCIVIYIPYLILASLRAIVKDYECLLDHGERVVYKFFIRSYFMKAVINPLVYGIFDPRFRNAVSVICKRNKRRTQGP